MKKILSVLLVLMMVLSLTAACFADAETTVGTNTLGYFD